MDNEIVTTAKSTTLTFGDADEIKALARRIKVMVRGGDKLSDSEASALAQISVVCRLNPFIGEVWYIPGKGPMVGIAGARRYEQEAVTERGGYSWPEICSCPPEEAGASPEQVKDCAAAFRCEIHDSTATEHYQRSFVATLDALRQAGTKDPYAEAKEIMGPKPMWAGYGFSTKSEASRMGKIALARKRAEADALKKRIVIPFGAEVSTDEIAPAYVDAQAVDALPEPAPKKTEAQLMRELGYDAPAMTYEQAAEMTANNKSGEPVRFDKLSPSQLQFVYENTGDPRKAEAALIVLEHDHNMAPPAAAEEQAKA